MKIAIIYSNSPIHISINFKIEGNRNKRVTPCLWDSRQVLGFTVIVVILVVVVVTPLFGGRYSRLRSGEQEKQCAKQTYIHTVHKQARKGLSNLQHSLRLSYSPRAFSFSSLQNARLQSGKDAQRRCTGEDLWFTRFTDGSGHFFRLSPALWFVTRNKYRGLQIWSTKRCFGGDFLEQNSALIPFFSNHCIWKSDNWCCAALMKLYLFPPTWYTKYFVFDLKLQFSL